MTNNLTFHPAVQRWFDDHFAAPSPPQAQGWPSIAAGQHTLILAPTGSGKTLAAFLWCIDDLWRSLEATDGTGKRRRRNPSVHTLYISPLKALNNDIHRNLQQPLRGIRAAAQKLELPAPAISHQVRTGDTPPHLRQSMVKNPPHILITTPESLFLLVTSARGREIFRGLKYLIVDEIHAICGNKRGVHLSLTLERLMSLCEAEPVRIGLSATQRPLERIAAFLGGQQLVDARPQPRPVQIIDCGQRKEIDLRVICPVPDFAELPEASVWPAVVELLYRLIHEHRTTLIFVNLRAQAERIARLLNDLHRDKSGDPEAELAQAHHGSISRDMRYTIEERLKQGKIPAVVATASLELGIDIGSIDLVVQLGAPHTIAGGLQRVGRSGHVLSGTSKGIIIPLFRNDLDDAAATAACMLQADIEETVIPENCLDVLAQQIVAEVAMQEWPRQALFDLARQSYCYRHLPQSLFDRVLQMLCGAYDELELRAIRPRLSWDRINDRLIALRGARSAAVLNGGTIPDRGYFGVYLADSNTRLGEMEEEFVFESRVGDPFFLGNQEWRIEQITHDRIIVSPVRAVKPRAPFWKGDFLFRDHETSRRIAAFRRQALASWEQGQEQEWRQRHPFLDAATVANLQLFLADQIEHAGAVATDAQLICEFFDDHAGEPHVVLHSPFGARVNGAWAIGLAAALEQRTGAEVQYSFDDDGIIMRLLDTGEPAPIEALLRLPADELERLIVQKLAASAVFAVYFRYNAARSLALPRSQPHKRIPLYLQRLRAADLLQVVQQADDFPLLLETYRECLQDVFDLPVLRRLSQRVIDGEVRVHTVRTPFPSPMAAGLIFDFLASNLYEVDRSRTPAQAALLSSEMLAEILAKEEIPAIVTRALVQEMELRWQHETPETQARDAEELFALIARLGPLDAEALAGKAVQPVQPWLEQLQAADRLVLRSELPGGWLAAEQQHHFAEPITAESALFRVRQALRSRGPVAAESVAATIHLPLVQVQAALQTLHGGKEVVLGRLLADVDAELWCDRQNFAELYRRAIAERREAARPAGREALLRFLLTWHRFGDAKLRLPELLARYSACRLPIHFLERELLRTRLCPAPELQRLSTALAELDDEISTGAWVVYGHREGDDGRHSIFLLPRGQGALLHSKAELLAAAEDLPAETSTVLSFLQENGASFGRDICDGTGIGVVQVEAALATLAAAGLVSCERYATLLRLLQPSTRPAPAMPSSEERAVPWERPAWHQRARRRRPGRRQVLQQVQQHRDVREVRWFPATSFAALGRELEPRKRAEQQARLLLQRHGVLVKEWYRHEQGLLPWHQLFQVLKRLEWQGEIRRGYFIEGLTGVQFALPEAVALLEKLQRQQHVNVPDAMLISTVDPALPFGGQVVWDLVDRESERVAVTRVAANHIFFFHGQPVVYAENYGLRLRLLQAYRDAALAELVAALSTWLYLPGHLRPRRKIEIESIDAVPAGQSELTAAFLDAGYERDGDRLVLWPSALG